MHAYYVETSTSRAATLDPTVATHTCKWPNIEYAMLCESSRADSYTYEVFVLLLFHPSYHWKVWFVSCLMVKAVETFIPSA